MADSSSIKGEEDASLDAAKEFHKYTSLTRDNAHNNLQTVSHSFYENVLYTTYTYSTQRTQEQEASESIISSTASGSSKRLCLSQEELMQGGIRSFSEATAAVTLTALNRATSTQIGFGGYESGDIDISQVGPSTSGVLDSRSILKKSRLDSSQRVQDTRHCLRAMNALDLTATFAKPAPVQAPEPPQQSEKPNLYTQPLEPTETQATSSNLKQDSQSVNIQPSGGETSADYTVQTFKEEDDGFSDSWHTVGIFKGSTAHVDSYIDSRYWSSSMLDNCDSESLPDLTHYPRISLKPDTQYRFRIAAINSRGVGKWGAISTFKTLASGFPDAPTGIKVLKHRQGITISWQAPEGKILEYSLYMALKTPLHSAADNRSPGTLIFDRVYNGAENQCFLSHYILSTGYVDRSKKPAIIFRVAARNERGYGQATQIRWLE